jgi:ABC-type glutathione transport system ATPase component
MAEPLLDVSGLTVEFRSEARTVRAVDGLGFSIAPGRTVAIVGESGSGKSVSALSLMRLIEREGGTIVSGSALFRRKSGGAVDLMRLDEPSLRHVRGNEISMIFQEPMTSLNPVLSIGEQLAEVLMLHQGVARTDALREARAMMDRVRIPDAARRLGQYPHELSGGMRQRVMIAMALFCRPALLIADEPTTALDVTIQREILELIRVLQDEIGMAVLFITHDMAVVAEMADTVVVMRNGEKVEDASVAPLFATPRHAYTKSLLAAVPRLGEAPARPRRSQAAPVLEVEGLVKRFPVRRGFFGRRVGHVHSVESVSFSIAAGETLGLVGESGCGKSTTGRALMKLIEPTAGRIRIDGRDVTALSRTAMRPVRRDVQMIFQDPYASLNPRLSVFENVAEPLAIHFPRMARSERRARAAGLLERVGMAAEHLDRYPHQFSGGQRQRLCIARALCLEPKIIVADEPVSALDVSVQAQVLDLMLMLQEALRLAYLFISHDMAVVERMSDRVAVMYLGQIVEVGPTAAVLHDPRHPYTRRLLSSVAVADPTRRRPRLGLSATEVPSPIHPVGYAPETPPLVEIAPGHLVQEAAPKRAA